MNTTISRLTAAASLVAICATPVFGQFSQDFETDTTGVNPEVIPGDSSNLNRVSSGGGYLGIPSASGGSHLELRLSNDDFETAPGYGASWYQNSTGNFYSGIGTSFSVYLDDPNRQYDNEGVPDDNYYPGDGWYFQPTLLNPAGDTTISGGGFGVRFSEDRQWLIAPTGNGFGFDDRIIEAGTFTASEGWYRFETLWVANGTGGIDQVNNVYLGTDLTPAFTATLTDVVADSSLAGTVGVVSVGQDVGSFMGDLAIDNISVIPEPSTVAALLGLFSLGAVVVIRRRKA